MLGHTVVVFCVPSKTWGQTLPSMLEGVGRHWHPLLLGQNLLGYLVGAGTAWENKISWLPISLYQCGIILTI